MVSRSWFRLAATSNPFDDIMQRWWNHPHRETCYFHIFHNIVKMENNNGPSMDPSGTRGLRAYYPGSLHVVLSLCLVWWLWLCLMLEQWNTISIWRIPQCDHSHSIVICIATSMPNFISFTFTKIWLEQPTIIFMPQDYNSCNHNMLIARTSKLCKALLKMSWPIRAFYFVLQKLKSLSVSRFNQKSSIIGWQFYHRSAKFKDLS